MFSEIIRDLKWIWLLDITIIKDQFGCLIWKLDGIETQQRKHDGGDCCGWYINVKNILSHVNLSTGKWDVEVALSWNYDVNNDGCKFDGGGCCANTKNPRLEFLHQF